MIDRSNPAENFPGRPCRSTAVAPSASALSNASASPTSTSGDSALAFPSSIEMTATAPSRSNETDIEEGTYCAEHGLRLVGNCVAAAGRAAGLHERGGASGRAGVPRAARGVGRPALPSAGHGGAEGRRPLARFVEPLPPAQDAVDRRAVEPRL